MNFFYYKTLIYPQPRIKVLKKEIFNNLPIVQIKKEDFYIYIRSGDIFMDNNPHPEYIQPPLCYYRKILDNLIFNKIYLISENNHNPVVDKLLNYYTFIIYNKNSIQLDIAYLVNAFNIIGGGVSSFFNQIILLNDNLQILYKYNMQYKSELNAKKFNTRITNGKTIFEIFTSKEYLNNIYPWRNSKKQREFMISFVC